MVHFWVSFFCRMSVRGKSNCRYKTQAFKICSLQSTNSVSHTSLCLECILLRIDLWSQLKNATNKSDPPPHKMAGLFATHKILLLRTLPEYNVSNPSGTLYKGVTWCRLSQLARSWRPLWFLGKLLCRLDEQKAKTGGGRKKTGIKIVLRLKY